MINICNKKDCTGCWACVNICPKSCITMVEGDLYHLYPQIDQSSCINCGLCTQICPSHHSLEWYTPISVFAGTAKNFEEYTSSTSGGAASVLSRLIIQQKGVVYGCTCKPNGEVCHIRVENEKDLDCLKGSKYVQSSINNIYKEIKIDLLNQRKVLFIGTPCQVAGIKAFLRKPYENLLTLDLICHGVPSLGYFKNHISKKASNITNVKFREGNNMYIIIEADGHEVYRSNLWKNRYEDDYYNSFIDGYTYRPSCHTCVYANPKRISDITVGDFWGITEELPIPTNNGLSCILVNTPKGKKLLPQLYSNMNIIERTLAEAVNGNPQLKNPYKKNYRHKIFNHLYKVLGIPLAYRLCELDHIYNLYRFPIINQIVRLTNKILSKLLR